MARLMVLYFMNPSSLQLLVLHTYAELLMRNRTVLYMYCMSNFPFCLWTSGVNLIIIPFLHTWPMSLSRRFRGDQNDKDTRTFCGNIKFLYNAIASTDNVTAQHKNCPSCGIDDRPGRDLFRVLKRSPISQPHTLGLRRGYSDGKAVVGKTTGLRIYFSEKRLYPPWFVGLLCLWCRPT